MNFNQALIAHLQGEKVEVRHSTLAATPWEGFSSYHKNCSLRDMEGKGFADACEYRLTPRTILVNGVEVPAPESEMPDSHEKYYLPRPDHANLVEEFTNLNPALTRRHIGLGILYLDKDACVVRTKAMLITQPVK